MMSADRLRGSRRSGGPGILALALTVIAVALVGACSSAQAPEAGPGPGGSEPATPVAVESDESGAGDAAASGELARADQIRIAAIERAVNETRDARHECWAFAATEDFRVAGSMVLRLSFTGTGGNAAVEVVLDEPGSERLRACVVELFERYRWPDVFEPGQAMELPLVFVAPRGQYTVKAGYVEPRALFDGAVHVSVLLHEKNTGNGAGALSRMVFTGDLDTGWHHHHSSTEILYVERGEFTISDRPGQPGQTARKSRGVTVAAGQAVYIPRGALHRIVHRGSGPTRVLQFFTPAGPQARYLGQTAPGTVFLSGEEAARAPRDLPRITVARKPTSYPLPADGGQVDLYFEPATTGGDEAAYMGVIRANPGRRIPAHRHPRESEYLMALEGAATMVVEGETYPVAADTAVQIPTNLEHSVAISDDTGMVAVQFYTPSGPEQRFKGAP